MTPCRGWGVNFRPSLTLLSPQLFLLDALRASSQELRQESEQRLGRPGLFLLRECVDKLIETLLRNDLIICDEVGFAPLDPNGSQLLFRFVAAAYERRSLAIASHWPSRNGAGPTRAQHRGQLARPAPAPQHRRRHRKRELPDARSPHPFRRSPLAAPANPSREGGDFSWPPAGTTTWPLTEEPRKAMLTLDLSKNSQSVA
jgi:IstB-like ATP binding protein